MAPNPLDDSIHVFVIERPSDAMIAEAVNIFVATFANDPPARMFTGADPARLHALGAAVLAPPCGAHMIVAADSAGALVAASFWTPPGRPNVAEAAVRERRLEEYIAELPEGVRAETRIFWNTQLPKFLDGATELENAEERCYVCEVAMVRPDHQGHGIGRAMFDLAEHKAEAMGATMLLWTGNQLNVARSKKLDWVLRGSADVPSADAGLAWTVHVLTKDSPSKA
ncbi:hypothetical protein K488DRAFT_91235 [Vararia minispora EC-137]|uniref:Uncharacterized protein n=1 Tax=Vararia minispora EC-137 TaxID=1314806 RepID=A0ACB8Q5Y6_9AGAM|nr:hypothetical protein K488DRAFT_91235 [Vararia minispora EC-137]